MKLRRSENMVERKISTIYEPRRGDIIDEALIHKIQKYIVHQN